ncbi:hypothetical protein RRF57_012656 [Xylaria bambusicola]|uniref:Uncharacterized protein n=1 Tax=Xylaria bambusicola TaxID=326684 RepID=A0AAN7V4E7_9PEZI
MRWAYTTKLACKNEVGILTLAPAALCHIKPNAVSRVFGWGGATRGHLGWILQELMLQTPLAEAFGIMSRLEERDPSTDGGPAKGVPRLSTSCEC